MLNVSSSPAFRESTESLRTDARPSDAFIRDELSKGRYDPAITGVCFQMLLELFERTLKLDLGPADGKKQVIENVC